MTDINIVFSRQLLKAAYKDLTPEQRKDYRKNAWVWTDGRGYWEFHWHGGHEPLDPNITVPKFLQIHPALIDILQKMLPRKRKQFIKRFAEPTWEFYWYGSADNAYHARYNGLIKWFAEHGTPEQKELYK